MMREGSRSVSSGHDSGQADVRKTGGANRGAVAATGRMGRGEPALPEWKTGHRPRGAEGPDGRLRRGESQEGGGFRWTSRGGPLAEAAGAGEVGQGVDRPSWSARGGLPLRRPGSAGGR